MRRCWTESHAAKHTFDRLIWLHDLALCFQRLEHPQVLIERAGDWNMRLPLALTIRYVQKLFAAQHTSVTRYIREERLAACRRMGMPFPCQRYSRRLMGRGSTSGTTPSPACSTA